MAEPQMAQGEQQSEMEGVAQGLGQVLRARLDEVKRERQVIELEWLEDLRQFEGIYDEDTLKKIPEGGSTAYTQLTRAKVLGFAARMLDMLFPGGSDRNWGINETPKPQLPPQLVQELQMDLVVQQIEEMSAQIEQMEPEARAQAIADGNMPDIEGLIRMVQAGQIPEEMAPSNEAMREAILDEAKRRAENMTNEIDDQLTEGRYIEHVADVILSGAMYGSGWLKGPMSQKQRISAWQPTEDGGWGVQMVEVHRPYVEFVPIWDLYPDPMDAQSVRDLEGVFQRYVMKKADVRALTRQPGFKAEAINEYLKTHPNGDASDYETWETNLRTLRKEDQGTLQAGRQRRYEVIEYTGYVDGQMLADCGCRLPEPEGAEGMEDGQLEAAYDELLQMEFKANVWFLGNEVVKAALHPYDDETVDTYHLFTPERTHNSLYGVSIARKMRDPQKAYNAAWRAALDNLGITSGPMFEVNLDLLTPEQARAFRIGAFEVIWRKGKGNLAGVPAIRDYQFDSQIEQFLKVMELAQKQADDATALPSYYTVGNPEADGAAETASGLSMLMGAANVVVKDSVRNYDYGITFPFIRALYHWNMQFNPREDIRGDFKIEPLGSTALVAKEIRAQSLDRLASTLNPQDPWIKWEELDRERFRANDLDPDKFMRTAEEVERIMATRAQQQVEQAQRQAA